MNSNVDRLAPGLAKLRRGDAGWILLGTLGVSCVIAGEFAGWNWGLARGGWGGMLIATLVTAVMYYALVLSIAELASIIPTAGGGYGFARSAFGPLAGFLTGTAVVVEYTVAVSVVAIFIEAYFSALTGLSGWLVPLVCFIVAAGLHCLGIGAAMRVLMVLMGAALLGIVLFVFVATPHAIPAKLFDIQPVAGIPGSNRFIPFGFTGIWACLPFALAGFMGIEGIPTAAEETRNPITDVPRGLMLALGTLLACMVALLCVTPAVEGSAALGVAGSPLVDALRSVPGGHTLGIVTAIVNVTGLIGLAASFFAAMFAYSRQVFALARAGYLPPMLALTNRYGAPWLAITVPGAIAFALCLTSAGDQLFVLVVFAAQVSYLLMLASHIKLRSAFPHLHRPYRTPGGRGTAGVALMLAIITFIACFLTSPTWSLLGLTFLLFSGGYYFSYARHRVLSHAPEEEFAMATAAAKVGPSEQGDS
jgi:ethanolamine permease